MKKHLLGLVVAILFVLIAVPFVEAQCGCGGNVDTINTYFACDNLSISWSHSSGIGSAILVVNYETLELITQEVFNQASGRISIDFDPPLEDGTTLSVLIIVVGAIDFYISDYDIQCNPPFVSGCPDGRLTFTLCEPLAVYPVESEAGIGLNLYLVSRGSDEGEFVLNIPAEVFEGLPDSVAQNCTIDSSPNGEVVVYLLTSGQIQINAGPDEEGKVFAYIFNDLVSQPVRIDSYVSGMPPEILPSCN